MFGGGGVLFEYSGIYSIHNIRQPSSIYMRPGDGSPLFLLSTPRGNIVMEVEAPPSSSPSLSLHLSLSLHSLCVAGITGT
jgi:hypothetical protein